MPAVSPPPATVNFDEGPSPFVQPNVSKKKMTSALVYYLDDTEHTFHIHKKAKGSVLIDMVIAQMGLVERDYFGLAFYDEQKTQHWLYPDKKIEKQLKGLPLEFFFKVKFYPPQPTQLSEDFSRHLLYLQLRKDVYSERLPVGFVAQASLGSLVAQAVLGDYQPMEDYASHLNNTKIAQPTTEQVQFINHVRELHKNHRGLTRQEAELAYLNECKGLALYGMHLFPAKDSKNKPVQVGVSFHGISVYNDQMRVHRFAWPGIVKISYRRSTFSIRLKPGELDQKKEASISYCLTDYQHAKLLWKCAVEHHGFFRLVQPEPKQKHSFLSFGSARFRYTGRTNVQSQMASQLFENSAPITGDHPSKSKSEEMIAQHHKEHSTPLNFVDELSPQKQLNQVKPMATSTAKKEVGAPFAYYPLPPAPYPFTTHFFLIISHQYMQLSMRRRHCFRLLLSLSNSSPLRESISPSPRPSSSARWSISIFLCSLAALFHINPGASVLFGLPFQLASNTTQKVKTAAAVV